jgi:MFS family permease
MGTIAIEASIDQDHRTIQPTANGRWDVDDTGTPIFFPFGRAFSGYRLTDAAAAQVRATEAQYRQSSSKFAASIGGVFGVGLFYLLALVFYRYPVAGLAAFYASVLIIVSADALLRFALLRRTLEDSSAVPARAASRQRLLYILGAAAFSLVIFWFILFLYDLQLNSLAADHPAETWFYPGIAGNVIFVAIGFPLLISGVVHFDKVAARSGEQRTTLSFVLLAVILLGAMAMLTYKFANPKPRITLSDYSMKCGWRHNWRDMSGMELSVNYQGEAFAVVKLRPPLVRALGKSSDRCEIDGLSVAYKDVYRAIAAAYQPHVNDP